MVERKALVNGVHVLLDGKMKMRRPARLAPSDS
jgi:hypothetical protein